MINLIPNEEKKRKVRDFYLRLLVVFFVVLSVPILIAAVGILPSYFLSSVKKDLINNKLEKQQKEPIPPLDQKTLDTVEDVNNKLSLVEKNKANKYIVSQKIINEIISEKIPDIKITEILYQNDPIKGKTVKVNGSAKSREQLLLFRRALEDNTAFQKVDLPISNFVKGSNIQFYLNLIPS